MNDVKVPVQVDGRTLTLTNLGKVLYPDSGFTKAEVLDYYQRVAPVLVPHLAGRPLTLKRYPEGVDGQAFFQKHVTAHRPDWIRTATVESESSRARGASVTYLVVDDLPALIWAANLAGLELHVPMWRMPHVREPDLLVFDLDPGAPANVVDCCRVACELRPMLVQDGLAPLAKTSGGKGLQLYAAVSGVTSEQASDQARGYAERLEREWPGRAVSRMTRKLRAGKVLIDWSQNNGSKTTVAPYSLRARQFPTVSTPVSWDEVEACRQPQDLFFTAEDTLERVASRGDLFAPLLALSPQGPDLGGERERVVAALRGQDAGAFRRAGVDGGARADPVVPRPLEEQGLLLVAAERGGHGVVDDRGRHVPGDQPADGQPGGRGRSRRRGQDQPRDHVTGLAERGQRLLERLGEQGRLGRRDLLQAGPVAAVDLHRVDLHRVDLHRVDPHRVDPHSVAAPAGQARGVQGVGGGRGQVLQAPAGGRRGQPGGGPPDRGQGGEHDGGGQREG